MKVVHLYLNGDPVTGAELSVLKISEMAGVGYKTARRWLTTNPKVRAYIKLASTDVLDRAQAELVRAAPKAVKNMERLSREATKQTGPQVAATAQLLDRAGIMSVRRVEHTGAGGGPMQGVFGLVVQAYQERQQNKPVNNNEDNNEEEVVEGEAELLEE